VPDLPAEEPNTESASVAVRTQILATEHWSLLATRSLASSESFNRATWFVTVVSAAVVALALVADSTEFGPGFRIFALLLLPLLVIIGIATVVRLVQLNREDVALVIGMNRLRGGYLDLAPGIDRYFVTGHREDFAGVMRTYGGNYPRIPAAQYLSSIPLLVSVIVSVLVGALAGLIGDSFDAGTEVAVVIGLGAALATLVTLAVLVIRYVNRTWDRR
jgi:hypothetical protein